MAAAERTSHLRQEVRHSGLALPVSWPRPCINWLLHSTSAGSMTLKTDGFGGFLVKTEGEPHACDPVPHRDQPKVLIRCRLAETQPRRWPHPSSLRTFPRLGQPEQEANRNGK